MTFSDTGFSRKEQRILETFSARLAVPRPKTKKRLFVGTIGLVGSGKTAVAELLSRELGAAVISADAIRIALRKKRAGYGRVEDICGMLAQTILARGGSVIVDSDFADAQKRNSFKKLAKDRGAESYFVRTVKQDIDTMIGTAITRTYRKGVDDFFTGAGTTWQGKQRAAVVKLREMWRRIPHHYLWSKDGGGAWIQKTIPQVYTIIDTSRPSTVAKQVRDVARALRR